MSHFMSKLSNYNCLFINSLADRIRTQFLTCRTRWFKKWTFRTELCYYSLVASNGRNLYTTGKRVKIVFLTVQIHCPEKVQRLLRDRRREETCKLIYIKNMPRLTLPKEKRLNVFFTRGQKRSGCKVSLHMIVCFS